MSNKQETNTGLRKELGLFLSVSIVGGIMIGSGIFYVSTYVLSGSGLSAGFAVLAWVIAGPVSYTHLDVYKRQLRMVCI